MSRQVALSIAMLLTTMGASLADRTMPQLLEVGQLPPVAYVRDHVKEFDAYPFDGYAIRLKPYEIASLLDAKPWPPAETEAQLEALRGIEWQRAKSNFIYLRTGSTRTFSWFDEDQWPTILDNVRMAATMAEAGHCKGLMLDPEIYVPADSMWSYTGGATALPFADVQRVVRHRGMQVMNELQSVKPDIEVLSLCGLSIGVFASERFMRRAMIEPDPVQRDGFLVQAKYALLPAFLNGMLDVVGPRARIIDGAEAGYTVYYETGFDSLRKLVRETGLGLIEPENRQRYQERFSMGLGLFLDRYLYLNQGRSPFQLLSDTERLQAMEQLIYGALKRSESYVWMYSNVVDWTGFRKPYNVPPGVAEGIRSALAKFREGRPLGFDTTATVQRAEKQLADTP